MDTRFSLFDTLTKSVKSIEVESGRRFNIYSCGPTVYRYVHVGNLRTFILADLVARAATYAGFQVFQVMNITDVGHLADEVFDRGQDKMLLAAETEGKSPSEIAEFYTTAFFDDIDAVGIRRASSYPRASQHIPQMIELIETLIDKGHAYVAAGNVYYDVTTFEDYGKLSGNTLDSLRAGHRSHDHDENKRHAEDFLLWRKASARRLLKFDSPWGEGFPGWHVECSAMSLHYLGESIDVHTGGMDLIFPHHEDEIAQSEGATGHAVVKSWVHGAHLLMGGKKMAKSQLNDLRAIEIRERGLDPLAVRYLCLTARYRKQLNFSWQALEAANTALDRIRRRLADDSIDTESGLLGNVSELSPIARTYNSRFEDAVLGDLDTPRALEVLNKTVEDRSLSSQERFWLASAWDDVLGLGLVPEFDTENATAADAALGEGEVEEIDSLVQQRSEARMIGDFATADSIRSSLEERGIELTDTPAGTVWRQKKP
jgi:cysteinyl-tRNA synthetase